MKKCLAHIPGETVVTDQSSGWPAWINTELPLGFSDSAIRNAIHHNELFDHLKFKDCYIYIYDSNRAYIGYYRNGLYKARREEW